MRSGTETRYDPFVDEDAGVSRNYHGFGRRPELPPCADGSPDSPGNIGILDSNGDEEVNVSDAVWLLAYLYQGGAPPSRGTDCLRLESCPNICGF